MEKKAVLRNEEGAMRARPSKTPQPLVASPVREAEGPQDPVAFRTLLSSIASKFPRLKRELSQSEMRFTPAGFVAWAAAWSIVWAIAILLITYGFAKSVPNAPLALVISFPVLIVLCFFYFMNYPRVKAKMRAKLIDSELVFAGRHMLIELKSGVPLFDAMLGVSREYGVVSEEFSKIVEKVTLGLPMGVALHSVAEDNPSQYFNRVCLQMANSLASGSDVALSLEASLDQIAKEQVIELKAYGQKLNPIAMFFMVFGIIMPSLGLAFVIIATSFIGNGALNLTFGTLLLVLVAIGIVQFLLLTAIETSRPKFDLGM